MTATDMDQPAFLHAYQGTKESKSLPVIQITTSFAMPMEVGQEIYKIAKVRANLGFSVNIPNMCI